MVVTTPRFAPKARKRFAAIRCEVVRRPGRLVEVADRAAPPIRCGYGACSKSGCNCKGFEGSASTCGNSGCGHAYSDHW